MTNRNITLAEIAQTAGVSPATVSRVLNGDQRVAQERIEKVNQAVRTLGYTPNRAARALATGKTGLIATVIDSNLVVFSDPFWGVITTAISRRLQQSGLQAVLMATPFQDNEETILASLSTQQVDGAIFLQLHNDELVLELANQGLPAVVVGRPENESALKYVDTDNRGGAYLATNYLIQRGAKRIATITGDLTLSAGKLRLQGFLDAMNENGLPIDPTYVVNGNFTHQSGIDGMKQLLAQASDVDAVFVANDMMCLGAIGFLDSQSIPVPDRIALVGFDDMFAALMGRQQLTTIHQDIDLMGATVAGLITELVDGKDAESIILPTHLVIRDTA